MKTPAYIGAPCYRATAARAARINEAARVKLAHAAAQAEEAQRFAFCVFVGLVCVGTVLLAWLI